MRRIIKREVHIWKVHRIDVQLLKNIEELLLSYSADKSKTTIEYNVLCTKGIEYIFSNLDEMLAITNDLQEKILNIKISLVYPYELEKREHNSLTICFRNTLDTFLSSNIEISYDFQSNDKFYLINSKLNQLLKNSRAWYSLCSRCNFTLLFTTLAFVGLFIYTNDKNIVYPQVTQTGISILYSLILLFTFWVKPYRVLKHKIFPYNEFRIGSNEKIEKHYDAIRKIIGTTMVLGVLVGIVTNIISQIII